MIMMLGRYTVERGKMDTSKEVQDQEVQLS